MKNNHRFDPSIITAKILEVKTHQDSVKLKICIVETDTQKIQIVCGASNVRQGMITILAPESATLPSGLVIKKATIRGIESSGMLCSTNDLGINKESGLIDLPMDTKIGLTANNIDPKLLSSTPWFSYKKVESHWLNRSTRHITITRDDKLEKNPGENYTLWSESYYFNGQYLYRSFH